ncbi:HAMP domain-containing sensor histidine kinase [Paraglaciecola sp. 25GB23A]|uniref:sensor histidine kinase n=1 Tax=Paraglaciecola sp. 25GB23A TaxID=3156068 RepID=UPI0032AF9AA3
MKLCFYQRMALSLVAVFILVMVLFVWFSGQMQALSKSEAEQKLHLGLAEHLVSDNPLLQQGKYDHDTLENLFHTLMVLGPNFEFYFVDSGGNILAYSAEPGKVKLDKIRLEPMLQLVEGSNDFPILGDDPRQIAGQKIFSAAPVYQNNILQGYLYVIIGGQIYDSIIDSLKSSQTLREFAFLLVSSMIFLLVALLVLFKYFTAPLKLLSNEMEQICGEDFQFEHRVTQLSRWRKGSKDEVQRLGCAFNDMLHHIDKQFSQLQQIDKQRRILLADLSHDLRTPLANLQGYIETLALNADNLSEQDRRRFVEISLKNSKNLKRLIDQIFELAYLEGEQVTLNQESFLLGELLYDITAKFALKAKEKNISLTISPAQFDFQVFADIGKLERVMTNLLENAIRHTPINGKVELEVNQHKDKLRINIRDSGVGISDKEIGFIFDARYQASNSEKDSNMHAGLGLAICKKLIDLFDSSLTVESQLGQGSCFSFELKLVS